ncbi:MAG: hypothetical protein ACRD9L_22385 [Bryobacteraceae bacterium]
MPKKVFSMCSAIAADGDKTYTSAVVKHLDKISALSSGVALFQEVLKNHYQITIVMTDPGSGNGSSYTANASPLLVQAINRSLPDLFQTNLKAALDAAKRSGIPLDFIARQLTEGLTAVTYRAETNVAQPQSKVSTPTGLSGSQVMALHASAAMKSLSVLLEFADGKLKVDQLPAAWKADLPRILRPWLTPGLGANATIWFDPDDWKPCAIDPAMKNRHPALGLVHEIIHALHSCRGTDMRVRIGNENLEEVITTGLPPYQFEEFSDNRFRTQFGKDVNLRMKY